MLYTLDFQTDAQNDASAKENYFKDMAIFGIYTPETPKLKREIIFLPPPFLGVAVNFPFGGSFQLYSKWLITMVSKSSNWGYSPSKWPVHGL